jgi:hypothetical protein
MSESHLLDHQIQILGKVVTMIEVIGRALGPPTR